jgi:hypothetical protein
MKTYLLKLVLMAGALLLGAPATAQLHVEPDSLVATLRAGETVTLYVRMTSPGAQSYCLDFDRPLQRSMSGCGPPGELLFQIDESVLGHYWRPYGTTMTPDGRIFAANRVSSGLAQYITYEFDQNLNYVRHFQHPTVAQLASFPETLGVTYNSDTGTLWWTNHEAQGHTVRRIMLLEGDLNGVPTGRRIVLPLIPADPPWNYGVAVGATYDAGTKRYYYIDFVHDTLCAVDTLGQMVEGYPVQQDHYPSVRLLNGMDAHAGEAGEEGLRAELLFSLPGNPRRRIMITDARGHYLGEFPIPPAYDGTGQTAVSGSPLRSRLDPNGVMYLPFATFDNAGVIAFRPARLSPMWLAVETWSGNLPAGQTVEIPLLFSAGTRVPGRYSATLQIQTGTEVATVPVVLDVVETPSAEPQPEGRQSLSIYPNPTRGNAEVMLELASPAHLVAEVFDVLGRRVRVLAEGHRQPGRHVLVVEGLAPGVYVVRAVVGGEMMTRRMTVL